MAFIQFQTGFSLLLSLLCLSVLPPSLSSSIHDLLRSHGLPAGLFPKEVKSFSLSETGLLEVYLDKPCLAKFDTMAFYETVVRANLTYRSLSGMEGLSQEELFLWLPVKDIVVYDPKSGLILFDIGVAHKQLSLSLFEDPPHCTPDGGNWVSRIWRSD
ncbi:serine protease, putative [Actinidia rufa]|uniref:Serine protease, putative n=1 Tax=Actinidia rufa TaxID=165716 RepID=A0A7J0G9P1_9ERIC|nr:serine protease, putative [Actinidia rufa]